MPKSVLNYYPDDQTRMARIQIINNVEDDNNNNYGLINFYANPNYTEFIDEIKLFFKFITFPKNNPLAIMLDDGNGPADSPKTKAHIQLRHENYGEARNHHYHVLFANPLTIENLDYIFKSLLDLENDLSLMSILTLIRGELVEHFYLSSKEIESLSIQYQKHCTEVNLLPNKSPSVTIEKKSTFAGLKPGFFNTNKATIPQKPQQNNDFQTASDDKSIQQAFA